jgi:hypothetical protein
VTVPAGATLPLSAVLPSGARFVGYRYEALDGWGGGDCVADQPCTVGRARWQGHPRVERGPAGTTVIGTFVNHAPDRERRARLTAYFRPASGWQPPG